MLELDTDAGIADGADIPTTPNPGYNVSDPHHPPNSADQDQEYDYVN